MKKYLFIVILLYFNPLFAQTVDSLQMKLNDITNKIRVSEGSQKLILLDSLSELTLNNTELNFEDHVRRTINYALELDSINSAAYHTSRLVFYLANRAGKPREGIKVFNDFISKNLEVTNPNINARLYMNAGDSYFFGGETAASIPFYEKAGSYAQEAKDSLLMGKSKIYTSDALADTGKFAEAGAILSESEIIFETMRDTFNLLTTRNSRANLYSRIGFFEDAAQVRNEIVSMAEKRKDYRMLQSTLFNASIDNRKTKDHKNGILNLKRALYFAEKGNLKSYEPKILNGLLKVYSIADSLDKAKTILNRIEKDMDGFKQGLDGFSFKEALAHYEFGLGNYQKAIAIAEEIVTSGSAKDFGNAEQVHELLTKLYEAIGNPEKAYYHHKIYAKLRDSIISTQNVRALTYYQTLYETKKRDATIQEQNAEIAFLDVQNKLKNQWILFGGTGLIIFFIIFLLVRSRKHSRNKKLLLEGFSQELIKGQEEERLRLARELHDSVGQKLMLLTKKTKGLGDVQMESLADTTLDELRTISRGLHPSNIEKLGLTRALEVLVDQIDANTDILFTHEIDDINSKLNPELALHVYRIVQEALNNMVKHSETRSASILVKNKKDHINVSVIDKGKGFIFTNALKSGESLGMRTLLERAKIINSKLEVSSSPDQGTTIHLKVPLS